MKKRSKKKAASNIPRVKKPDLNKGGDDGHREDDDKHFDFGGLPERNLKKNLGC